MDNFINQVISYTGTAQQPLNAGYYQGCSINFGGIVASSKLVVRNVDVVSLGDGVTWYGPIEAGELVVVVGKCRSSTDYQMWVTPHVPVENYSLNSFWSDDGTIQTTLVRSSANNYNVKVQPDGSRPYDIYAYKLV
jgi:hypothetical protein